MLIVNSHRTHRMAGILLLAPLLVWALSAIFFLVRPSYFEAYEQIPIHTYPLTSQSQEELQITAQSDWREFRYFRSILGDHLLVRTQNEWQHLHADSLNPWPLPGNEALRLLLDEAISANHERYGSIASIDGHTAMTDTGVEITVDWGSARITQYGNDTRWIDRIYSLHYLQWTGISAVDRVLGVAGLFLLLFMTYSGWRMAFNDPAQRTGR